MIDPINPAFFIRENDPDVRALAKWLEAESLFGDEIESVELSFSLMPNHSGEECVAAVMRLTGAGEPHRFHTNSQHGKSLLAKIFDSVPVCSARARFIRELVDRGEPGRCKRTGRVIVRGPRYTQTILGIVPFGKPGRRRRYAGTIIFLSTSSGGN